MANSTRRYQKILKDTERWRNIPQTGRKLWRKKPKKLNKFSVQKNIDARRNDKLLYIFLLCLKVNDKPLMAAADLRDFVVVAWSHEILFSSLHDRSKRTHGENLWFYSKIASTQLHRPPCFIYHVMSVIGICNYHIALDPHTFATKCKCVQLHAIKSSLIDQCNIFIAFNKNCMRDCHTRCNHMRF